MVCSNNINIRHQRIKGKAGFKERRIQPEPENGGLLSKLIEHNTNTISITTVVFILQSNLIFNPTTGDKIF